MVEDDHEEYSPYCEICSGCGEDGCCTHTGCFRALVQTNPNCKYGKSYLIDALDNKNIVRMTYRLLHRLKNKEGYTKENFIEDFERFTDRIYSRQRTNESR